MFSYIKKIIVVLSLLLLVACASISKKNENTADVLQVDNEKTEFDSPLSSPKPPNFDLDQNNLEKLLLMHFASYSGQWTLAAKSALNSAQASQDYRLAEIATSLAFQAKEFEMAAQAAQLWYELTEQETARRSWITMLLYGNQVEQAIELLDGDLEQLLQAEMSQEDNSDLVVDEYIKKVSGLLLNIGESKSALRVSQHYVNQFPQSAQVLISSAYVANYFKRFEQAQRWLDTGAKLKPDWDLVGQIQANIYQAKGEKKRRSRYLSDFVKKNPQALQVGGLYATDLAKQEKYQVALDYMKQMIEFEKTNAQLFTLAGIFALKLKDDEAAKSYFQTALKLDPQKDQVRWELARLAEKEKQYRLAEGYYQKMSQKNYQFSAHLRMANLLNETEGVDMAIQVLDNLEPNTQQDYINKVLTKHYFLMDAKRFDEAYGDINEALVYLPENTDFLYSRALVAAEVKAVEIAENDLRFILSIEPNNANVLNALGYTLADQTARYQEALMLIEKALKLEPEATHIIDSMGWILYRVGEYKEAAKFLQQAYDKEPLSDIAAHLGEVLWEMGKREEATSIWSSAFKQDQHNTVLNETLKKYKLLKTMKQKHIDNNKSK